MFDNAHVSTFSSRFEDWRKVDLKATAQLQQHVKSLQKLNESIGGFLARCSAVETFQEFHGTIDTLSQAIFELKDFREAFTNSIEEISDGITQRILTSLRAFDEERYSWLHKTLEAQGQSQESMIITQRKILNRLDSVGYSVDQQARASQAQKEQLARVDAVQSAIQQDCQCLVDLQQNVFKSFRNSSEQQESLQDNIFSKIGSGMENLESYLAAALSVSPTTLTFWAFLAISTRKAESLTFGGSLQSVKSCKPHVSFVSIPLSIIFLVFFHCP